MVIHREGKEKPEKPSNAPEVLAECLRSLDTIQDELLREVAKAIFAPLGTLVPKPSDHARSLFTLSKEIQVELFNRGGLAAAFRRDQQAYGVFLEAVNKIHELYRANELKHSDGIFNLEGYEKSSLFSALRTVESMNKRYVFKK